jgi:hypothetical protein
MNGQPKRILTKSRTNDDVRSPRIKRSAIGTTTNARGKSPGWDDSDSDDSLPLGSSSSSSSSSRKNSREARKARTSSLKLKKKKKTMIDQKTRKIGCGISSDNDSSHSSSSSSSSSRNRNSDEVDNGNGSGIGAVSNAKNSTKTMIPSSNSISTLQHSSKNDCHSSKRVMSITSINKIINAGKGEQRIISSNYHVAANTGKRRTQSQAEIKANQIDIPEDITSINQLQWHKLLCFNRDSNRTMELLQPCRVLSRGAAAERRRSIIVNKGTHNSNLDGKDTVIQYITLPNIDKGIYKCVNDNTLIPFGFASKDGLSATFNDDYLRRYIEQNDKTMTLTNLETMKLLLKRAFRHAMECERKSRGQAEKDLQDYYDGSSDDDAGNIVPTGKVDSGRERVQFEVMHDSDDHDDGNEHCDDNEENHDNLDLPYTQAITFDPDDFGELEGRSNEPIRPGDVIEYYCPIFVTGDKRGLRQATVLAVDPKDTMPLVLSNGEGLPNTTKVKRIKVMSGDELVDHPGIFREMNRFHLIKRGNATAADAIAMEAARFGAIMTKNINKLQEKAGAEGFAPMDLLVNIKGVKANSTSSLPQNNASTSRETLLPSSSDDSSSDSESCEVPIKKQRLKKRCNDTASADSVKINNNVAGTNRATISSGKHKSNVERLSSSASLGTSFASSSASLGSSLATSSDGDDSSIDSIPINLGMNHMKSTQCDMSSPPPPKGRKLKGDSASKFSSSSLPSSSSLSLSNRTNVGKEAIEMSSGKRPTIPMTKLRQSPSSDSSSSDDDELVAVTRPRIEANRKQNVNLQQTRSSSSEESSGRRMELARQFPKGDLEPVKDLGWSLGKAGWEKSAAGGTGFCFGRYK